MIALCVTMFIAGIEMGPIGAFLSELFRSRYRYTATGLSYSVAGVIGGAVPPLMAVPIITTYGGLAFRVIMAGLCLITLLYTLAVPRPATAISNRSDRPQDYRRPGSTRRQR